MADYFESTEGAIGFARLAKSAEIYRRLPLDATRQTRSRAAVEEFSAEARAARRHQRASHAFIAFRHGVIYQRRHSFSFIAITKRV